MRRDQHFGHMDGRKKLHARTFGEDDEVGMGAVSTPSPSKRRRTVNVPPDDDENPFENLLTPTRPSTRKTYSSTSKRIPLLSSPHSLIKNHESVTRTTPTKVKSTSTQSSPAFEQILTPSKLIRDLGVPEKPEERFRNAAAAPAPASTFTDLQAIKDHVLSKILGRTRPPIANDGIRQQFSALRSLLYKAVAEGESNSCLVMGAEGSGKSLVSKSAFTYCITNLSLDH